MRNLRPILAVLMIGTYAFNVQADTEKVVVDGNETVESDAANTLISDAGFGVDKPALEDTVFPKVVESVQKQEAETEVKSREDVWTEINLAIAHLNRQIGSSMFRDLKRLSASEMEVRLDSRYWDRVVYQTRVSLKKDISDIWHLFVIQYNNDNNSAVFFIDDETGKTIDIFTRSRLVDVNN